MRMRDVLAVDNPARSWARRLVYGTRSRPDVQALRLERRLEIVERLLSLDSRAKPWVDELVTLLAPEQPPATRWKRIGSIHDGGYVVPIDAVRACTGAISIGVGDNNDADIELASWGLPVHAWDHTVDVLPLSHPMVTFHRVGVGHNPPELLTLDAIVDRSFGPSAKHLALLLDAEGAEWDALSRCEDGTLGKFLLIAAELHGLGDMLIDPLPQLDVLRRLNAQFVPVAVHANNHTATWEVAGVRLVDAIEVTWINRDFIDASGLKRGNCPAHLLAPCCPDLPDIELTWASSPG